VETEHESRYPEDSDIVDMSGVVTCQEGPLYVFRLFVSLLLSLAWISETVL
jgi:hypothetical protein